MFNEKWKAALTGATVCGFLGPGMALLLLEFQITRITRLSFREILAILFVVLRGWIFASVAVGPAAFVFGGVGGLLLQRLARNCRSMKRAIVPAAMLGLVLGSAVPVVTFVAVFWGTATKDPSYNLRKDIVDALPVAALTGVICSLLLLCLFHATRLLDRRGEIRP